MCTVCYYRKISPLFSTNEVEICIGNLTYKACYNNNNVTLHSIPCRNINQRTTVKFTNNYGMIIYTLQLGSGRWGYELALRYCLIYYLAQLQIFVFFLSCTSLNSLNVTGHYYKITIPCLRVAKQV